MYGDAGHGKNGSLSHVDGATVKQYVCMSMYGHSFITTTAVTAEEHSPSTVTGRHFPKVSLVATVLLTALPFGPLLLHEAVCAPLHTSIYLHTTPPGSGECT